MKIPQKLPQFVKNHALLIVSGKQVAKIFFARNHGIVKLQEIKMERPQFSDNEGFSTHGPRGRQGSVSGSEREIREPEIVKPFLKMLNAEVKKILQQYKIKEIYIFTPDYMSRKVPHALPQQAQRLVRKEVIGNYLQFSPVLLLHKITPVPL